MATLLCAAISAVQLPHQLRADMHNLPPLLPRKRRNLLPLSHSTRSRKLLYSLPRLLSLKHRFSLNSPNNHSTNNHNNRKYSSRNMHNSRSSRSTSNLPHHNSSSHKRLLQTVNHNSRNLPRLSCN